MRGLRRVVVPTDSRLSCVALSQQWRSSRRGRPSSAVIAPSGGQVLVIRGARVRSSGLEPTSGSASTRFASPTLIGTNPGADENGPGSRVGRVAAVLESLLELVTDSGVHRIERQAWTRGSVRASVMAVAAPIELPRTPTQVGAWWLQPIDHGSQVVLFEHAVGGCRAGERPPLRRSKATRLKFSCSLTPYGRMRTYWPRTRGRARGESTQYCSIGRGENNRDVHSKTVTTASRAAEPCDSQLDMSGFSPSDRVIAPVVVDGLVAPAEEHVRVRQSGCGCRPHCGLALPSNRIWGSRCRPRGPGRRSR